MRRILDIGHNELRLFLKSRVSFIWLFVIPFGFIYAMSFVIRPQGDPSNRFPPVLIENKDTGFMGAHLIDTVCAQGLWRWDAVKNAKTKPVCGIRIPVDFTQRVLAKQATNVEYFTVDGSSAADTAVIEARLIRALVAVNSSLLEASTAGGGTWPPSEQALKDVRAKADPVALDARFAGRQPTPSGFNFSLPGNLVYFLLMNLLIFGGSTVAAARNSGVLRRILTLPVSRGELIAGQIYGLWLLGAVQIVFFLLVGRFLLGVSIGANLPAVLLVLLVFAWVAASFGVLVGSVIGSADRIVGVCVMVSMLMGALGGCWFPMELAGGWARMASRCVPTGWAMEALHQLISFGNGIDAVLLPLFVLVAFGTVANLAAARLFRV